ncbi:MAG: hypothetical protein ACRC0Y_08980 [Fusobacteriaceae bacterium]
MEIRERLNNFIIWLNKEERKNTILDSDLYYQNKLVARKGYSVISTNPAVLYRINCLFDDLFVNEDVELMKEFLEILENSYK